MSFDSTLRGTGERFSEVLEAKIEAKEGLFEEPHPFLRTAVRGLASRLNGEFVPVGFVLATELYALDMNRGMDGFTGEPMPATVTGIPLGDVMFRIAAKDLAREAFGSEFTDAVNQVYAEIR